jgi:hypothetical protein
MVNVERARNPDANQPQTCIELLLKISVLVGLSFEYE